MSEWTLDQIRADLNPTPRAQQTCAQWLQACLTFGWKKSELDALEVIWWRFHDRRGRLVSDKEAA